MLAQKTHRLVKEPRVSARYLADYMAASERARRTILRNCKYVSTAKVVQHDRAKSAISHYFCSEIPETGGMSHKAAQLRNMMADDDFDRDVLDYNADYIDKFVTVAEQVKLPAADRLAPGTASPIVLEGVRVSAELHFRLRRIARGNKVRTGGGMLRYAKGRALDADVAAWQSAFMLGYLKMTNPDPSAEPQGKLCLTIDAHLGKAYAAPTDSVSRFQNMEAACAGIAERWEKIAPPPNAIL
jgi:hypothetical protein